MDPVSLGAQLNSVLLQVESHDYNEVYETAYVWIYEMEWEESGCLKLSLRMA